MNKQLLYSKMIPVPAPGNTAIHVDIFRITDLNYIFYHTCMCSTYIIFFFVPRNTLFKYETCTSAGNTNGVVKMLF